MYFQDLNKENYFVLQANPAMEEEEAVSCIECFCDWNKSK